MSETTLTHRDLANALGVSETTIKSYRRKFPGCIPVANKGKPIRFKQEALEICIKIRDLFGTGMSVEEVSERLSVDFPWCKGKQSQTKIKGDSHKVQMELPQNFSTAISNLAKSMIAMRQQQTTILSSLQRLESLLTGQGMNEIKSRSRDALSQEKAFAGMVDKLERLARMAETSIDENKNMSLRLSEDRNMFLMLAEKMVGSSAVPHLHAKSNTVPSTAAPGQEVPKMMLSYPLVVRDSDGSYMSAGGKSMGKVSLNDLKAMLAHAYHPPAGYVMRWEHKADGWWVTLEQPDLPNQASGRRATLQVFEISSSKGVGVLEVKHYKFNGESRHPSDFSSFIANIGK